MGYTAVKDISANVLPAVLTHIEENEEEDEDDNGCLAVINGMCYKQPAFKPTPVGKSECEELNKKYGLSIGCTVDNDYYMGAIKACNADIVSPMDLYYLLYQTALDSDLASKMNVYSEGNFTGEVEPDEMGNIPYSSNIYIFWAATISSCMTSVKACGVYAYEDGNPDSYTVMFRRNDAIPNVLCAPTTVEVPEPEPVESAKILCEEIEKTYNIKESNCTVPVADASGRDFSEITPHIILSNGLRLYIGSEYEEIEDLSDSTDAEDKEGFIFYIDVNGTTGKSKLYEDVFPYMLLKSGKVVLAYEADNNSGGTNSDHLSINVLYDTYDSGNRQLHLLLRDANFRKAACTTGYITSKKYCGTNNIQYDVCKDETHDCRLLINRPIKIF